MIRPREDETTTYRLEVSLVKEDRWVERNTLGHRLSRSMDTRVGHARVRGEKAARQLFETMHKLCKEAKEPA